MNWKKFIETECKSRKKDTDYRFNPPVTHDLLHDQLPHLGLSELPSALEELYHQSNGIEEVVGDKKIGELVWSLTNVIKVNNEYRTYTEFKDLYMSFDQLLFFSEAENGDLFGFVTLNGTFQRHDIFVWNHENDSRTWVAPDLATFLLWWTQGRITV